MTGQTKAKLILSAVFLGSILWCNAATESGLKPEREAPATTPARPRRISVSEEALQDAIKGSDDFGANRTGFLAATRKLVETRFCTLEELKEQGGWMKSQSDKTAPVYFTYCGGRTLDKKLYLNVRTGRTYR